MSLYTSTEPAVPLTAPALIVAFDGWVDAAGAATAAAEHLTRGGETIATFDGDLLFDFRSRRPVLDIVDGTLDEITWPELTVKRVPAGGRDLLILSGAEPDFRWRELGTDVLDLCLRSGVVEWISLGAIPGAVPHTRPVPVLATASAEGLLHTEEQQGPVGLMRVPSAALSAIEMAVSGSGIPAVGFYAQVPPYVGGPYPAATIALLEHLGRHLGVDLALGSLPDEAARHRERLDAAAANDPEVSALLERLTAAADEESTAQRLPSGDEIAAEVERFLRDNPRDPGEPPGFRG